MNFLCCSATTQRSVGDTLRMSKEGKTIVKIVMPIICCVVFRVIRFEAEINQQKMSLNDKLQKYLSLFFLFCRNVECVNLLLSSGAELDIKDNLGR